MLAASVTVTYHCFGSNNTNCVDALYMQIYLCVCSIGIIFSVTLIPTPRMINADDGHDDDDDVGVDGDDIFCNRPCTG